MIASGEPLGHYRVGPKLGEGGMGVVYRAHDTRLGRDVAIKVLPEAVSRDPERLARFEREARTLAALNHPNIAAVYGVAEEKRQISSGGGEYGRWSRNGKEIFFVQGTTLHAVPVGPDGVPVGAPKPLFALPVLGGVNTRYTYDVAADGSRILLGEPVDAEAARPTAIHVVENWPALLRKR